MLKDRTTTYTHGNDRRMPTARVPRGANITYSRTIYFDRMTRKIGFKIVVGGPFGQFWRLFEAVKRHV